MEATEVTDDRLTAESLDTVSQALREDEQGIAALADAWGAAWAAKDAVAFASLYTEDARFIGPVGATLVGRAAIQAQHAFLFSPTGPFPLSTQSRTIANVNFLKNRIAVVDLDAMLTGYTFLPPGLRETAPGVFRATLRWIVVKQDHSWRIEAQQNTPIPPAPPAP